jgi:SNF2 family DNA or RNA helicase
MQFASSHAEMEITGEDEYGELKYQVHLIEPSNKIDELLTVMEECEDEPIAVFAPSRQLIEMASRRLVKIDIPHGLVTGKVSEFRRQESIDDFQEGRTQLILCTSGAGGTGITLTAAPVLVRLQRSWRQDENEQTVGRVHRHGSEVHEHVRVIDLISPDTVEDRQLEVLAGKFGNMQSICRDQETMRYILTGKK